MQKCRNTERETDLHLQLPPLPRLPSHTVEGNVLTHSPGVPVESWGQAPGDVLQMFPRGDLDVATARVCIVLSVVGSYVTLHFAARSCLEDLLLTRAQSRARPGSRPRARARSASGGGGGAAAAGGGSGGGDGGGRFSPVQNAAEILVYLVGTVAVAMVVTKLDLVLDFIGSTTIIPLMFVFPGWLQLKMDGNCAEVLSLRGRYNGPVLITIGGVFSVCGFLVTASSAE